MYKLYSLAGTCSTGISVLLNKLGEEFTITQRGDVDNYQQLVPTNQVPALEDGGLLITEGAAIALYLLEKHNSEMLPQALPAKAQFLQWLMFNFATLHPMSAKLFAVAKCTADSDESNVTLMQALADNVSATWKIVNERLASREYMVGETASIIDYLLPIYANWGNHFRGQKIELGEHVTRLISTVVALPEFIKAIELENITVTIPQYSEDASKAA